MAHEGLWEQLERLDHVNIAERAGCKYIAELERYVVRFLNRDYTIDLRDKNIFCVNSESQPRPVSFLEQLCLLAYLIHAKDIPLAEKLVGPESLAGGQFFFRGLHSLPTDKLEKAFGQRPEGLCQVASQFDAKICGFGDASIELLLLPRIPLTIIIWAGDDEFDARASMLFDESAASQLPLDALLTAVNLAVDKFVQAASQGDQAVSYQ